MKKKLFLIAIAIITLSSFIANDKPSNIEEPKKVISISPPDEIISIVAPDVVKSKSEVEVLIKYSAKKKRDIYVFLQKTSNWKWYAEKITTVEPGVGSLVVKLNIPKLFRSEDEYRWGAFITKVGGGYEKKIGDEAFIFNVDIEK